MTDRKVRESNAGAGPLAGKGPEKELCDRSLPVGREVKRGDEREEGNTYSCRIEGVTRRMTRPFAAE